MFFARVLASLVDDRPALDDLGVENRTGLGKCTHKCDEKQGNKNTSALPTNCLLHEQED